MTGRAPVRAGGSLVVDGVRRAWSVADGSRGRRWRCTLALATGAISWTLETDPSGAFIRLEAASPFRLLALHREADGSLHGHVLTPDGFDPVALPAPAPELVALDDPLSLAAALAPMARRLAVGEGSDVRAAIVTDGLRVLDATLALRRTGGASWEVALPRGSRRHVALDADGLPVAYGAAAVPMGE